MNLQCAYCKTLRHSALVACPSCGATLIEQSTRNADYIRGLNSHQSGAMGDFVPGRFSIPQVYQTKFGTSDVRSVSI